MNRYVCFLLSFYFFMSHAYANIETGKKQIDIEKILKNSKRGRSIMVETMLEDLKQTSKNSSAIAAAKLLKDSKQGNISAQLSLAYRYAKGKGVPKDMKKAIFWFKSSANQGNATAQRALGTIYKNGKYIPKDLKKAKYWYTRAANQGDERAMRYLKKLE